MKIPSMQVTRVVSLFVGVACAGAAVTADNRWLAMANALLAGLNFAAVFFQTMFISLRENFDKMIKLNNEMHELNRALIHDKVIFHLNAEMPIDDDDERPKLH